MKIFCDKLFALVLLRIFKDSLDYIWSRNDQGENRLHIEKRKKKVIFVALLTLFITNAFSASHEIKLFVSLA